MRKIVRKDNSYRKKILSISLVLFLFMGIGYSVISTNLLFNGNIELSKYESPYLYDVLKLESLRGGLARKYTGEHHDSFTEEPSKDIYHWYAANDTEGTSIQDKNNVIFAGHCWQMIRTTDTGGVKMIYNGEAEIGQCLNTRGNHVGYTSSSIQVLSSNYWYGTDYTYDSINKVFSISGTTEQIAWKNSTYEQLIGKYTCKSGSEFGTCSTLYLVESYYNASSANVIPLNSNSNYSQFGTLQFNSDRVSPSYVGYMYGDIYESETTGSSSQSFSSGAGVLSVNTYISSNSWYADSFSYDSVSGRYSLVNPYQVSNPTEYPNLVGKYTFSNASQNYTNYNVFYITAVDGTRFSYKTLAHGEQLSDFEPIIFGDSITDNGNGTYTINNPISLLLTDWYSNHNTYVNKYTCGDNNAVCANPRYITSTTYLTYNYINGVEKIMIGKTRNGLTLGDTLLVRKDEWYNNYNNYGDYKYTCNTDSAVCTEETLRIIISYNSTGYNYVPNRYYGASVTWDGTNYTLVDPIELENYNSVTNLSTHHYICPNYGEKVCSKVGYIYYYTGSGVKYYISLENGVITVSDYLENMLAKNTNNSTIKSGIDAWYKHYLFEKYYDYLEDTIFCSDRSILSLGGWDFDGGLTSENLQFKEYTLASDLSCTNITDKYSVSNNNAKLTYKVGLMSSSELNILNNDKVRKSGKTYWLGSPFSFTSDYANARYVLSSGVIGSYSVNGNYGLRPTISLKPGSEYIYGDGSMENPYVVKPVKECTYNGDLTQGAEFVDGQYTYRYMQKYGVAGWKNNDEDGWSVMLTDLQSTDPVNTRLCTTINNKPIVSMNDMFLDSQATSIDVSSFDTSNVTDMSYMFDGSKVIKLDLRGFDTSKVTDMRSMFESSSATSIDLSNFDTHNVTNMSNMFKNSSATSIDLSNFDTHNVTDMSNMFKSSSATSIDVSSFKTNKVTSMRNMFESSSATSIDISSFNNSNVTDSNNMFCNVSQDIITSGSKFTFKDEMFTCVFD